MAPINKVTKMLSSSILVMVVFVCFFAPKNSFSQTVESAEDVEMCSIVWENIWPKAKEGDLEARFHMLVSLASLPGMKDLLLPGSSRDKLSQYRDVVIWGIYSSDHLLKADEKGLIRPYREVIFDYVGAMARSYQDPAALYIRCIDEKKKGCGVQAVQNGLVPPFSDSVKKIEDALQRKDFGNCKEYFIKKNKVRRQK